MGFIIYLDGLARAELGWWMDGWMAYCAGDGVQIKKTWANIYLQLIGGYKYRYKLGEY